jgi:type I restriction enzyme S subunit
MEDGGKFPESFENYQVVNPNQIIFCLFDIDETPRTVGLSTHKGMITSAYDVFSTSDDCDSRFINYYYLSIDNIKGLKPFYTGLRKVVRSDTFLSIPIYLPELNEQKKIADFLDNKLLEVDGLISQIELKIKLLEEQKVSLIDEMIVKGFPKGVLLESSEVDWIGPLPKTWEVKKLKFISSIGLSSVDRTIDESENSVSICHYPQVYNNEKLNKNTELSTGTCSDLELKNYTVLKDDILITKDSESSDDIGIPSFIDDDLENTVCGYHISQIRISESKCLPEYVFRFIQSERVRNYFMRNSDGVTRFGLGKPVIENLPIPIPPMDEQLKITKKINDVSKGIFEVIELEKDRIDLLREYRQCLIRDVVSGKLKVI